MIIIITMKVIASLSSNSSSSGDSEDAIESVLTNMLDNLTIDVDHNDSANSTTMELQHHMHSTFNNICPLHIAINQKQP